MQDYPETAPARPPDGKLTADGGDGIGFSIFGITVTPALAVLAGVVILCIILAVVAARRYFGEKDAIPEEQQEDIFLVHARVNPHHRPAGRTGVPGGGAGAELQPPYVELLAGRGTITESLRALAEKYSLKEITLATDDGLVLATSAARDVQLDAVTYTGIARLHASSDDPEITLFELMHKDSNLIGIIRRDRVLSQHWKRLIMEDTKGILQWWL